MTRRYWARFALPRHARDAVLADLLEEAAALPAARAPAWVTRQLLQVAWAYQWADLRQPTTLRALALGTAGFALLQLALAPAAHTLVAAAAALGSGWSRLLAVVWSAPQALAAVAAAVVIGMAPRPVGALGEGWRGLAVIGGAALSAALQGVAHGAGALACTAACALAALACARHHRNHLEWRHA